jgi:hypothetical protein
MTQQQVRDVPGDFAGSLPELIVLQTLVRLGLQPGVDFVFQSPLFGGRLNRGGLVIDFLFSNPPDLAINVQGSFFHFEQGGTVIARDVLARAQLAGEGITLIFIDEEDVLEDPVRFVRAALQYQDLSRLGRGA